MSEALRERAGTATAEGRWTGERRFLAACRRERVDRTPVWFMRQAGRASPGYERLRERHSVVEIATTPELAARAALLPVEAFGVDAAVLFADIMLPLGPMGVGYELTDDGPVVAHPIRAAADVARLREVDPEIDLASVLDGVRLLRGALDCRAAVIGLAGGPFTLAGYLVEGGPSREHHRTKALMYGEPSTWHALLERLADVLLRYLQAQVDAGAQAVQLFDSWAGALSRTDYELYVAPHTSRILGALTGAPSIHFATSTGVLLEGLAEAGGDVIGVDATHSLAEAWRRVPDRAIQGNLDGARLLAGWPTTEAGTRTVLADAGGRPGHIFNLGHGIAPGTDPGVLRRLVEFVHGETAVPQ